MLDHVPKRHRVEVRRQIRLLESELGVEVFARSGKHLTHITPVGETIIAMAGEILREAEKIKQVAQEYSNETQGSLSIATTHTQARYALPSVIKRFRDKYPDVSLHMNQGSPLQIAELAANGNVDFAIATEGLELFHDLIMMPCYCWNRSVVVPAGHPMLETARQPGGLTLADVAKERIVTYVFGFTGRSRLDAAFNAEGLSANVVFTATDTDVIKTYVRLELGIGIIATMALDPAIDADLVAIDAAHLFTPSVTHIGFRRGTFLRRYMYDFIEWFAPHLSRERVDAAVACGTRAERAKLFSSLELPQR